MKVTQDVSVFSFDLDDVHDFLSFLITKEMGSNFQVASYGLFSESAVFKNKKMVSEQEMQDIVETLQDKYSFKLTQIQDKKYKHLIEGSDKLNSGFVELLKNHCGYEVVSYTVNLKMGRDVLISNYEEHPLLVEFTEYRHDNILEKLGKA